MHRIALTFALSAGLLAACGGGADNDDVVIDTDDAVVAEVATAAELMIGEWDQVTPIQMTAAGQSFSISDGEVEYDADGTAEIEAVLTVDGLPEDSNRYAIDLESTYTLNGDMLSETFTSAEVSAMGDGEQADVVAQAIQDALAGTTTTTSTVVSIDEETLVRRVDALGATLRYTRD